MNNCTAIVKIHKNHRYEYCQNVGIEMADDDGDILCMCQKHWESYIDNSCCTKAELEQTKHDMIVQAIEEGMSEEEADRFLVSAGF